MSNKYANSIFLLGHPQTAMGEGVQISKFSALLKNEGYQVEGLIDLCAFFGEKFESIAELNYALASADDLPLTALENVKPIVERLNQIQSHHVLLLSWCFGVAAVQATGLFSKKNVISKFYVHHPDERVLPKLYNAASLLITESLLANQKGIEYGIDREKLLYIPHHYPLIAESFSEKHAGEKVVVGVVGRLDRGKNVEHALEVVRLLIAKGAPIELFLMGDFGEDTIYNQNLEQMLDCYCHEPWLIWDKEKVPYPDVLQKYQQCDLFLQLSGAEAGSNVIVELLGMGKPVVLLDCSTNPYLFKGGACFVKGDGALYPGPLPFSRPCMEDLEEKVAELIAEKGRRKELAQAARLLAQKRFHPNVASKRMPLLFSQEKEAIRHIYEEDRREYGLE
ncbi:MAG: glycosyltransferase family 4 protein [Chlamydiales bacterium]